MKQRGKQLLARVSPGTLAWLSGLRLRRHLKRLDKRTGLQRVRDAYLQRNAELVVRDGPFKGMRYLRDATGSMLLPKLIGCYELELRTAVEGAIHTGYQRIIDVGCAEGYYAIGLALRLPQAQVFAFDTDPFARKLCRRMAELNGVAHRVTIAGQCTAATLQATIQAGATLIVCDCEGYESELLDPRIAGKLAAADVLVEFHDVFKPGVSTTVTDRFRDTHEISTYASVERDASALPGIAGIPPGDRHLAMSEFRHGPQLWAFMRHRTACESCKQ